MTTSPGLVDNLIISQKSTYFTHTIDDTWDMVYIKCVLRSSFYNIIMERR